MEANTNNGKIERDTLQFVMEEFTQEQKTANQNIGELIIAVKQIGNKIDEFKKQQKIVNSAEVLNTKPVGAILQKGFLDIKFMIGRQPKNIVRKFQILLFPEQDAKLFYKIVFGKWFLCLVVMLAIMNLYNWGIHYTDSSKEIELEQIKNDRIRKAWEYMYSNTDKETKRLMEKAFEKSLRDK